MFSEENLKEMKFCSQSTDSSELDETWKSLLNMRILIQKKGEFALNLIEVVVEEVTEEEDYVKMKDAASDKFFWDRIKTVRETENFKRIKTIGLAHFKEVPDQNKIPKGF